jgi:hypothetical protein
MTWSGASLGFQRRLCREDIGFLVDGIDVDEIGSKIWDEDVLLGGVEECFMWVRGVLTAGYCPGAGEGVGECLGGGDVAGRRYVVRLEGASGAVVEREGSVAHEADSLNKDDTIREPRSPGRGMLK